MTQIFLNYRTTDEPVAVAMLDQVLSERFGSEAVFLASKSIPLGMDWEEEMFAAVEQSTAVLALVGRSWLDVKNADGRRALDDPGDFVRRELATAFRLCKQVIPVLLGVERQALREADLPPDIRELSRRQSMRIAIHSARPDVDQLVDKLRRQVPALRPPENTTSTVRNSVRAEKVSGSVVQSHHLGIGGDFTM